MCSGVVERSCLTSGTNRTHVENSISFLRGKDGIVLRHMEHIGSHLWHRRILWSSRPWYWYPLFSSFFVSRNPLLKKAMQYRIKLHIYLPSVGDAWMVLHINGKFAMRNKIISLIGFRSQTHSLSDYIYMQWYEADQSTFGMSYISVG